MITLKIIVQYYGQYTEIFSKDYDNSCFHVPRIGETLHILGYTRGYLVRGVNYVFDSMSGIQHIKVFVYE